MRFRYSVSFESDLRPVDTIRGEVIGSQASGCVRLAFKEASEKRPNRRAHWRSAVVVLEKLGEDAEETTE